MPNPNPDRLRQIKTFPSLVKYLRDELEWPIESDDFDELTFDYEPEELGLDAKAAAKIKQIKQLRPLADNQPWGIFFINFEPKRLPVVALRRILRSLVIKKRQSANRPQQAAWKLHDLLFISSYGEQDHRDITFAHFSEDSGEMGGLPTLRVLGWDDEDTVLHLAHAHDTLTAQLRWPDDEADFDAWRERWSMAFTLRHREVIDTSKALAVRMAALASAIRKRANRVLSVESEKGPLRKLMSAFKEALIHDLSDDDFADMYAQTITYGLLTARVSRPAGLVADNVTDMVPITNPFLKELMETFLNLGGRRNGGRRGPGIDFDELGINDVVDTLRAANMEAVLRDFGDKNPQEDPVIHFYERFLKEYDAKKRMQRGVFYTPRPVVSFIVRSVDELLRTEFDLEDGLADITTWGEIKKRFDAKQACAARDAIQNCGAGFQPAPPPSQKTQARMPVPQEIMEKSDPRLTAGSCVLKRPDVARIVQDALLHFEGRRYRLAAWCVMPNHVHVVVQPLPGHELKDILHSWKSFTATKINRLLRRKGSFWERESFNHLIRCVEDVERFAHYTEHNPVAAGFTTAPSDWPFSSCGAGFQRSSNCGAGFQRSSNCGAGFQRSSNCGAGFQPAPLEFVDPRTTPFVEPRTRGELPHLHKEGGTYFITWRLLDAVEPSRPTGCESASSPPGQDCDAGFQPPPSQECDAGFQPPPGQECDAGFQPPPGQECGAGFQPASSHESPMTGGREQETNAGKMPAPQFQIPDGVSPDQPFVQILDPATGTGTFLVEVIDVIYKTMTAKWEKEGHLPLIDIPRLWNDYVPKHLLPRLHGYELLMAPYAIAHMKIGLKLYETGYRFESDERARVYLTNALEPAQDFSETLAFAIPALAHEAEAVNAIKRDKRFTVAIGNPPYSNYGQQNQNLWISRLLEDYKQGLNEKKLNLDDDYIRFLRLGHHIIAQSDLGVLGFITNHTYLDGVTHRRLRERLIESFGTIHVFDIHGSIKKAERTPDGSKDENVFDIQQGVAIGLFVRLRTRLGVLHSDLWGTRAHKSQWLQANSVATCSTCGVAAGPDRFYFVPHTSESDSPYGGFVKITDIFDEAVTGFETARDHFAIAFSEDAIRERIVDLLGCLSDREIREKWGLDDKRDWTLAESRERLRSLGNPYANIRDCCYRPFDVRFTHYDTATVTWPRKKVLGPINRANPALVASRMIKGEDPHHFFIVPRPTEKIFISAKTSNNAFLFPMYRRAEQATLLAGSGENASLIPNVRDEFLATVGNGSETDVHERLSNLFSYIYAVFHSMEYRIRYAEFLKRDFPRLPIPTGGSLFSDLVDLGDEVISLHLMESPKLGNHIATLVGSDDFPVEKVSYSDETVWLDKAKTRGFRGVPEDVWNFHIGGYQVCHKWLKDRQAKGGKNPRPGRVLTDEDIDHYQKIVVALNETIRIMAEIDEVINAHGGWPDAFVTDPKGIEQAGAKQH